MMKNMETMKNRKLRLRAACGLLAVLAAAVLTAADGQSLNAVEDLVRLKQSMGAGDTVSLTYVRSGQSRTVSVTLIDPDEQT